MGQKKFLPKFQKYRPPSPWETTKSVDPSTGTSAISGVQPAVNSRPVADIVTSPTTKGSTENLGTSPNSLPLLGPAVLVTIKLIRIWVSPLSLLDYSKFLQLATDFVLIIIIIVIIIVGWLNEHFANFVNGDHSLQLAIWNSLLLVTFVWMLARWFFTW